VFALKINVKRIGLGSLHLQRTSRGRILGRNWDKSSPPCYSQSPLIRDFTPPPPFKKSGLELVCNVNIVNENLKSEKSQNYAQKPQQNCTFMNSASA
jgi:hypothetical protein